MIGAIFSLEALGPGSRVDELCPRRSPRIGATGAKALAIGWLALCAAGGASAACSVERVGTTELVEARDQFELPVVINGSPAIHFLVDTGAEKSAIDTSLAQKLALPEIGRRGHLIGSDGLKGRTFSDVTTDRLALAGVAHVSFPLAVGDLLIPGKPTAQAVIGANLLAQYDVEFDFLGKRLNLYRVRNCHQDSSEFKPWATPHDVVPLKAGFRNLLSLPISIDGKVLELLLDTGAVRTKISMDAARKLGLDIEKLKAYAQRTTSYAHSGRSMTNYSQRFNRVQIGESSYRNVEIKIAGIEVKTYDGLLGLDFLRTRKVWVSYATRQLLVEQTPVKRRRPPRPE